MNLSLRRSTSALLASSLLLTIGRGATLPFMTIYLSRQYSLSVDLIGYAMTIALTIGVVFSLGFGILADKFDKKRYMLLAITHGKIMNIPVNKGFPEPSKGTPDPSRTSLFCV